VTKSSTSDPAKAAATAPTSAGQPAAPGSPAAGAPAPPPATPRAQATAPAAAPPPSTLPAPTPHRPQRRLQPSAAPSGHSVKAVCANITTSAACQSPARFARRNRSRSMNRASVAVPADIPHRRASMRHPRPVQAAQRPSRRLESPQLLGLAPRRVAHHFRQHRPASGISTQSGPSASDASHRQARRPRARSPSRSAAKALAGSPFCSRSRPDSRSTRFSQNRRPSGRTSARTRRGGSASAFQVRGQDRDRIKAGSAAGPAPVTPSSRICKSPPLTKGRQRPGIHPLTT
jgi:hypothetical protein